MKVRTENFKKKIEAPLLLGLNLGESDVSSDNEIINEKVSSSQIKEYKKYRDEAEAITLSEVQHH